MSSVVAAGLSVLCCPMQIPRQESHIVVAHQTDSYVL